MTIWDSMFWKDTVERVIFTVLQVLIAVLSADGLDLVALDWVGLFTTVGIAAALVLFKAVSANILTGNGTVSPASFAKDDRGF